MSVEIHVACRRDPSAVAQILQSCRIAQIEVGPARTVRAWSPRAHATLLLRERDVAGVVTFRAEGQSDLVSAYAELVARALEGVAVIDGEVFELAQHDALSPAELASAWNVLEGRTDRILEERQADKRRRRDTWARAGSIDERSASTKDREHLAARARAGSIDERSASTEDREHLAARAPLAGERATSQGEGTDRDYSTH